MSVNVETNGTDTTSWLNKKFLSSVLRHEENDAQVSILDFDVQSVVPVGDNYASLLMRVNVEYYLTEDENNKLTQKRSLIVKTLPVGEMMQQMVSTTLFFEKESHMYEVTLPAMYELVQEKTGIDLEHLATDVIPVERQRTIVLNDLRPDGYKMADRRQGLDLEHSIFAIRTLAKLHGYSLALFEKDPSSMEFYRETMYTEENRKMLTGFIEHTFTSLANEVDSWKGFERFGDKIRILAKTGVDRSIAIIKSDEESLRVLNHGDFWTNNMMFRYHKDKIADIKMIDFQMARFASPALDIQYFLHTSPRQDVLEDNWDQLLAEYHDALCNTLSLLNCQTEVTLQQIEQEMEDKAYFGVITSCMFCIMVAEPQDAPDLSAISEENMETEGAQSMNKAFAGRKFRSVFERRLPRFEKRGLI